MTVQECLLRIRAVLMWSAVAAVRDVHTIEFCEAADAWLGACEKILELVQVRDDERTI